MQSIHHRYVLRPIIVFAVLASMSLAQVPDHPIITRSQQCNRDQRYPVGRDPTNLHQEFIEIYLPTAANLNPSLNRTNPSDFLRNRRRFRKPYAVINQRFDLPPWI